MPLAVLGFLAVGFVCVSGFFALRGKPSPAGKVVPLLEPVPEEGEFGRLCSELIALGFEPIGDFKREVPILNTVSTAVLRAFRSDERRAEAVVYRVSSTTRQGVASSRTVLDFVSELDEEHSLTTSTAPMGIFLPDPNRPSFKHPFVRSATSLWKLHAAHARELWGGVECARPPRRDDFARRLSSVILRQMRYQAGRGLYHERAEGMFFTTDRFALLGLANYFLHVGDPASWRAPLFFVVSFAAGAGSLIFSNDRNLGLAGVVAAGLAIAAGMPKGTLLWLALYVAAIDTLQNGHGPAAVALVTGMIAFWIATGARTWAAARTVEKDSALS